MSVGSLFHLTFGDLDLDRAAVQHRVARVDREVEDREFKLVGVDPGRRQSLREYPAAARRAAPSERSSRSIMPWISTRRSTGTALEILLPRECQQRGASSNGEALTFIALLTLP